MLSLDIASDLKKVAESIALPSRKLLQKLLKIGAVITCNTRTIREMLSSQYPEQDLFLKLASKLVSG